MLIRHLSYFATLAREHHFARAAAASNVAQPTLSAAIRKLEDDLGVRLVVRDQRFVRLTEEGEKLLSWANQILADYDSLRADLAGLRRGLTGTLRLGVIPAAMPAVAFVTARFAEAHPLARVEIRSMTSRAIQRALDALELDGGLTYLENEPLENVRKVPLYHERYVFVARRDHPAGGRDSISWTEAAAQRLCLLSEDMQNRRIVDRLIASIGARVDPVVVSNSFVAIFAQLRHGALTSIVPHTFVSLLAGVSDLLAIDLVEPVHVQAVGLVLSDRDPLSPMARALLASFAHADLEGAFGARARSF